MRNLPVIVGFGGVNPAGRASNHLAYRRMIHDKLSAKDKTETLLSLALLMGLVKAVNGQLFTHENEALSAEDVVNKFETQILSGTLIRKIHPNVYDAEAVHVHKKAHVQIPKGEALKFILSKRDMPETAPDTWKVVELSDGRMEISTKMPIDVLIRDSKKARVTTAGQLPTGLEIGALYPSRNHPKGLEMTIFAASDALGSVGIDFELIKSKLSADQIGVYACSSMGQLDDNGVVGFSKAASLGKRATSKQLPLGFPEMPGDFINAYMIGNAGYTSGVLGACATYLYNLEHAVKDIQAGRRKVAIVGVSEAPVNPEVMEGYRTMGALAEDSELIELDSHLSLSEPRYPLACRPFGNNCGFTMGESAQFSVLFSADFALEMGARVYGAVPGAFIHADAYKKSISSPGIGNYLSLGRAVSLANNMLGEEVVKRKSYVHAHGTGTPQNRVTESHVINEIAKANQIQDWSVTSVKCYVGHSLGAAGGDQMMTALGTWQYGYIPGIFSVDQFADDIHDSHLNFSQEHLEVGKEGMDIAFLNSKGFGGNNATACVMGPHVAEEALEQIAGKKGMSEYCGKREAVDSVSNQYQEDLANGEHRLVYKFGEGVLQGEDLVVSKEEIKIPGYKKPVSLNVANPYKN